MNKRKLDSLLWENIPFENFIIVGHSGISQENLDDVFWDDVDELCGLWNTWFSRKEYQLP